MICFWSNKLQIYHGDFAEDKKMHKYPKAQRVFSIKIRNIEFFTLKIKMIGH